MKAVLRMNVAKDGQRYVDDAIYLKPKHRTELALSVAEGLRPPLVIMLREVSAPMNDRTTLPDTPKRPPDLFSHYERVNLRWMKPGPGGLVPK